MGQKSTKIDDLVKGITYKITDKFTGNERTTIGKFIEILGDFIVIDVESSGKCFRYSNDLISIEKVTDYGFFET
jgi:hypothetical protein